MYDRTKFYSEETFLMSSFREPPREGGLIPYFALANIELQPK